MKTNILLVEDDTTLSMIIKEALERYNFEVTVASNGEEGMLRFTKCGADLIIADVMMPVMSGFEMGRRIRQINRSVPLLFLTAKAEIGDIVEGFELGGNDYLKKPFKMLELIVRIKALLRRNFRGDDVVFDIGLYQLDMSAQLLRFNGRKAVELTLIEAKILKELAENRGYTVDASTLMMLVWQRDDPYSRNSLHGFMHKLRHYLRHDSTISIINQRGIGYMLTVND